MVIGPVVPATVIAFIFSMRNIADQAPLACTIDFVHLFIMYFGVLLVAQVFCEIIFLDYYDSQKLMFLNIIFVIMVVGVLFFGMCPLTIWYNNVSGCAKCRPFLWSINDRCGDQEARRAKEATFNVDNDECHKNTLAWWKGQKLTIPIIVLLNMLFVIKSKTG